MAPGPLRREVLKSFKAIHRTRNYVFQGDRFALDKAREEINENYRKNKGETDSEKIKDLIKFAYDVINELKTNVVQMKAIKPGRYHVQLRPEMFQDETTVPPMKNVQKCSSKKKEGI
ncbi:UNVERIFIED_CONTAM: hypothetical protein PYX00_008525 [Menopon gallinae]|uniref:Complex III assembly factor LYRM7 n=1 Tax=Menopon gallinae TaxID=328185 RepID=A0AAW2HPR2_9NEOP